MTKHWNIDQKKALNIVEQTTQRGVRSYFHPTLVRRMPANDRMLRYNWLPHQVCSDKVKGVVLSARGNKYGQAFYTQY